MSDVRYNQEWFPLEEEENNASVVANLVASNLIDGDCETDACTFVTCPAGFVRQDVWRLCRCV